MGQCVPVLARLDGGQAVQCRTVAVPEYGQTGGFDTFRPIMGVLNGARAEMLTVGVEYG